MSHIPQHLLLPQDKVDILDKETGKATRMHASDARHAMDVEPTRYVLAALKEEPPAPEATENEESDVE